MASRIGSDRKWSALPSQTDDENDDGEKSPPTVTVHSYELDREPSETLTETEYVPEAVDRNSKEDESDPTGTPFTSHAKVTASDSGSWATTEKICDAFVSRLTCAAGEAPTMTGGRLSTSSTAAAVSDASGARTTV